jgi:hypothetical protein
MPTTIYDKLVEWRENSLTEQPNIGGGATPINYGPGDREAAARNQARQGGASPGTPSPSPARNKLDLNALLKAGKAYAVVFQGQYRFVIFYNETKRGWSVAINREGNWTVWGDSQPTLSKAFAQAASGL